MIMIMPSAKHIVITNGKEVMKRIEKAARCCYASYDRTTEGSDERLIRSCIKRGHESILEHDTEMFMIICDRGVSHELVRHRLASYSQESTRYVAYDDLMYCIAPSGYDDWSDDQQEAFREAMELAELNYHQLREAGLKPEEARAVLPNAIKTMIYMTANLREWRHFLRLRCSSAAHPDMRVIAFQILDQLYEFLPVVFEDIYNEFRRVQE